MSDLKTGRLSKPRQQIERGLELAASDFLAYDGWRTIKTDLPHLRGLGVQEKGMADRLYIRYQFCAFTHRDSDVTESERGVVAQVLWIEWKSPTGRVAQHQKDWQLLERKRGALIWVAKIDFKPDYDSFVEFYRKSGLLRRPGL